MADSQLFEARVPVGASPGQTIRVRAGGRLVSVFVCLFAFVYICLFVFVCLHLLVCLYLFVCLFALCLFSCCWCAGLVLVSRRDVLVVIALVWWRYMVAMYGDDIYGGDLW